jgi:hypothetical protein
MTVPLPSSLNARDPKPHERPKPGKEATYSSQVIFAIIQPRHSRGSQPLRRVRSPVGSQPR